MESNEMDLKARVTKVPVKENSTIELKCYEVIQLPGFVYVVFETKEKDEIFVVPKMNYEEAIKKIKEIILKDYPELFRGS